MQVAVVSEERWYAIDVYERRGSRLVKRLRKGPFLGTSDAALTVLNETVKENPGSQLFGHVFDARIKRWVKWP
jgi:hypothetical protein